MMKAQLIEQLRSRSVKVYSNGKLLDDYRLYGDQKRKKYYVPTQEYDENSYNQVQNFLYKQALFGLSIYNKRELAEMPPKEKGKISKLRERTQGELNILKQKLIIERSNALLELFPNSPLAQTILTDDYVDPELENKFSFRDLGIKKEEVISRLCKARILPENFHQINAR